MSFTVSCTGMRAARPTLSRAAPVKAVAGEKALAVGAAASLAVLLSVAPADAGVSLEQPKLKNALVTPDEPAPPSVKKELPDPVAKLKGKAAEVKSEVVKSEPQDEAPDTLNVQALWPLGVVAAGGALFALGKVDKGFADLFDNAVKDSGTEGIGYEDSLKNSGGYAAPYYEMTLEERMQAGTKALKKGMFKK
eukprot:jgi/Ulvmu1/8211/UM041_0020.1